MQVTGSHGQTHDLIQTTDIQEVFKREMNFFFFVKKTTKKAACFATEMKSMNNTKTGSLQMEPPPWRAKSEGKRIALGDMLEPLE